MAQNQYDPYGSEQGLTFGGVAGSALSSPFKPSSYLGLYTTFPGMYSIEKGIWAPFVGKALEEGGWGKVGSSILDSFKNANKAGFKGWMGLAGSTAKNLAFMGHPTGGFVGQKWLNQNVSLERSKQVLEKGIFRRAKKFYGNAEDASRATTKAMAAFGKGKKGVIFEQELAAVPSTFKKVSMKKTHAGLNRTLKETVTAGTRTESLAFKSLSGFHMVQKSSQRVAVRTAAKIGIGALKGASIVGATMFAWDMLNMVGEPVGRAIVRGLDNTLSEYQRRFMPEVGGQLQMSYLSRGAATERQRAIQAISKSYINGRSAMGSEASYLHQ